MIVKPRIRGFICTTAHPAGCAANVAEQIDYVQSQPRIEGRFANVLVIGCSGGYGLASRITTAFGAGSATLGVSFEKPPTESRTATQGWYTNAAFEEAAEAEGLYARTLDGDAFSDGMKAQVIDAIRADLGKIDLLVYSLASPVRPHPRTGVLHRSAIKPIGETVHIKTLNVEKGIVHEVDLEPATEEEIENTVAVMGGEDWELWIDALRSADVLASGFRTIAFTYIGSDLTWPIYWEGTLGKAKEDLDRAAAALRESLDAIGGDARVATLKAIVSQASSAIPVVPLYASLLFRVMKEAGTHENIIQHIYRLFATQLAEGVTMNLDETGRIRVDDWELDEKIQNEVRRRWPLVTTENLDELADLEGFREDFLRIFGFGIEGVDYEADQDPTLGRKV
ncbi:MAG: trans-2-enoyl-CoA reductase family protein [Pseudomonadales bacterium]|jgi:enoyl-[acyl-carrier protein] reductase/trans-2-enoyl-CoA reductase (NAD+)